MDIWIEMSESNSKKVASAFRAILVCLMKPIQKTYFYKKIK